MLKSRNQRILLRTWDKWKMNDYRLYLGNKLRSREITDSQWCVLVRIALMNGSGSFSSSSWDPFLSGFMAAEASLLPTPSPRPCSSSSKFVAATALEDCILKQTISTGLKWLGLITQQFLTIKATVVEKLKIKFQKRIPNHFKISGGVVNAEKYVYTTPCAVRKNYNPGVFFRNKNQHFSMQFLECIAILKVRTWKQIQIFACNGEFHEWIESDVPTVNTYY